MATKKKTTAAEPEQILPPTEETLQVQANPVATPDEVWAEVLEISKGLGIDTKMAIDLLQLTVQINEHQSLVRLAFKPEEIREMVVEVLPFILKAKEANKATEAPTQEG